MLEPGEFTKIALDIDGSSLGFTRHFPNDGGGFTAPYTMTGQGPLSGLLESLRGGLGQAGKNVVEGMGLEPMHHGRAMQDAYAALNRTTAGGGSLADALGESGAATPGVFQWLKNNPVLKERAGAAAGKMAPFSGPLISGLSGLLTGAASDSSVQGQSAGLGALLPILTSALSGGMGALGGLAGPEAALAGRALGHLSADSPTAALGSRAMELMNGAAPKVPRG